MYKIRDWILHFEQDRSKQWKNLKWVPIPNKQGAGYRKIMSLKNGLEIFGCWIALVQQGSLCNPRGDLSKYDIGDLSRLTLISEQKLQTALDYLSQVLDWIEVINNLDKNVNNLDKNVFDTAVGSSILCNSILSNSKNIKDINIIKESFKKEVFEFSQYPTKTLTDFYEYWSEATKNGTKCRWQLQPTWELPKRLANWVSREKGFKGKNENNEEYEYIKRQTVKQRKIEEKNATEEKAPPEAINQILKNLNEKIKSV